jgi:hypothetical protein
MIRFFVVRLRMFKLRNRFRNWRQTLAPGIVWAALAGNAALCCFAPASLQTHGDGALPGGRFAATMISLASRGF